MAPKQHASICLRHVLRSAELIYRFSTAKAYVHVFLLPFTVRSGSTLAFFFCVLSFFDQHSTAFRSRARAQFCLVGCHP